MKITLSKGFLSQYENYFQKLLENEENPDFDRLCEAVSTDLLPATIAIYGSLAQILLSYTLNQAIGKNDYDAEVNRVKEHLTNFCCNNNFPREVFLDFAFVDEFYEMDKVFNPKIRKAMPFLPKRMLKSFLIKNIQTIGKKLDEFDLLEKYRRTNNNIFFSNYMLPLTIKLQENDDEEITTEFDFLDYTSLIQSLCGNFTPESFFPTTVKGLFNTRYLEGLSTYKLLITCLFWTNKFAKAIQHLISLLLLLSTKKNLVIGLHRKEISFNDLSFWFSDVEVDINKSIYPLFQYWKAKYVGKEVDYSDLLYLYFPEDLDEIFNIYQLLADTYLLKQLLIFLLLEEIENGDVKEIKNYGLVESEMSKNMWLMAFDIPGYNLPVMVHLEKESILYYYSTMKKTNKIRLYLGMEDFFNDKVRFSTSILYPLTSRQKEFLKSSNSNKKELLHMRFLQDGKWPAHLRDKNGKPQKKYFEIS